MTLLKRILTEKRAVVFPLLFALLVNLGVYALVVYPLNRRAAGAVDRAAKAADALRAAERDQAAAQSLVAGKARAEEELATFYDRVLPADYVSARRMTYTRLLISRPGKPKIIETCCFNLFHHTFSKQSCITMNINTK